LLGLACGLAVGALDWAFPLRRPPDAAFTWRGPRPTTARVVLVGLDEASLKKLRKPSPHVSPELARVVRLAKRQGAAAIGVDLLIPEDLSTQPEIANENGAGDARPMGAAVREAGNVVLPRHRTETGWEMGLLQWRVQALEREGPTDLGFVDLTEDGDRVVRRQQLLARDEDEGAVPHFALALYAQATGRDIKWDNERSALLVGGERVPLDADQKLLINFVGPPGTFPVIPFHEALAAADEGRAVPEMAGAVVLIGLTGDEQRDHHATPYARRMAGVELHANIFATLHDRAYLRAPPRLATLAALLVWGPCLGLAFTRLGAGWGALLAAGHSLAWLGAALLAFRHNLLVGPSLLLLGLLVFALCALARRLTRLAALREALPAAGPAPEPAEAGPPDRAAVVGELEEQAFSSQAVVIGYPAPVAMPYRRFLRQQGSRLRLDMMFAAAEAALRYLVTLGLADLFQCLSRHPGAEAALLRHPAFEFLRSPRAMQLGMWCAALRETARLLADEPDRFVEELPRVCRPGGHLDSSLLASIVDQRNRCVHAEGSIALTEEECQAELRAGRPRLEEALLALRFTCRYSLGLFRPGLGSGDGQRRYLLHPCMGAQVGNTAEAYAFESPAPLPEDLPFVLSPDGQRLLFLWPWLTQRVSAFTGRHTLYAFESIAGKRHPFLTEIRSAAIDVREDWAQVLQPEPAASHTWLVERLRRLPAVLALPPGLALPARLGPAAGDWLLGQRLGPHRLLAVLGTGGFGTVYAAEGPDGRRVAVKVLDPAQTQGAARFRQEFEKLRQAGDCPAIIRAHESGVTVLRGREYAWYSMELAAGGDLNGRMEDRRPTGPGQARPFQDAELRRQVVEEVQTILAGVAHLHGLGIVHRDVKPGNVLVLDDGQVRLSDFGLVKSVAPGEEALAGAPLTSTGAVLGTRRYMAPEQEKGAEVGKPADVYSLGVLLAELLLGEKASPSPHVGAGSTLNGWATLGQLPGPWRKLILACTDVSPDNRPADAQAVQEQLARCL
jgi:CHASE2 domain-containing sensor protein